MSQKDDDDEEEEYNPYDDPAFEKLGGFDNVMEKIGNFIINKLKKTKDIQNLEQEWKEMEVKESKDEST